MGESVLFCAHSHFIPTGNLVMAPTWCFFVNLLLHCKIQKEMSFLEILLLLFGLFVCVVGPWFCLVDSPCYHDSSNKSRRMMGAGTCSPQRIEPLPCLAISSSNSSPLL